MSKTYKMRDFKIKTVNSIIDEVIGKDRLTIDDLVDIKNLGLSFGGLDTDEIEDDGMTLVLDDENFLIITDEDEITYDVFFINHYVRSCSTLADAKALIEFIEYKIQERI